MQSYVNRTENMKSIAYNISNTTHGQLSSDDHYIKTVDVIKATWICVVTLAIVICNILMIAVLNSKHHSKYLRAKSPRYLMTSLACSDLAIGILVTPFTVYPTLYHEWPYGATFCAIQALLLPALFHQSTLSLLCVAIDRYICIVHALKYHSLVTRKVCFLMIAMTWMLSFGVYSAMIYPNGEYRFDAEGIMNCEPSYNKNNKMIIIGMSLFYLPPSITIFYCYTSIFVAARRQLYSVKRHMNTPTQSQDVELRATGLLIRKNTEEATPRLRCDSVQQYHVSEKRMNIRAAVTLSVIAISFFLAVTPWTLVEVLVACFNIRVGNEIQFATSWMAVSNSFWNVIIYGMCNRAFRTIAKKIIIKVCVTVWRPCKLYSCSEHKDRDKITSSYCDTRNMKNSRRPNVST